MRPAPIATVLTLLAATALGACGGPDKGTYATSVTNVQRETQRQASDLTDRISQARTPEQIGVRLSELGRAIEEDAGDLERIEAPDDVAALHAGYVKLTKDFGSGLETLAGQVESGSSAATRRQLLEQVQRLTADFATGEQKLVSDINARLRG